MYNSLALPPLRIEEEGSGELRIPQLSKWNAIKACYSGGAAFMGGAG